MEPSYEIADARARAIGGTSAEQFSSFITWLGSQQYSAGYAYAVERLLGVTEQIPRRAYYCRVIAAELCRIMSHHVGTGTMVMDRPIAQSVPPGFMPVTFFSPLPCSHTDNS